MAPRKKAAASSSKSKNGRTKKTLTETVQEAIDAVLNGKEDKAEENGTHTAKTLSNPKEESVPKAQTDVQEKPFRLKSILRNRETPAVRAARRISQNAFRRLSNVSNTRLSGSRKSSMYLRKSSTEGINGRTPEQLNPFRKPATKTTRVRIRESVNTVLDISCLPDKIPGRVRMPDSPLAGQEPPATSAVAEPTNDDARPKRTSARKRVVPAARARKKKVPITPPSPIREVKEEGAELREVPVVQEKLEAPQHPGSPPAHQPLFASNFAAVMDKWDRIQNEQDGAVASGSIVQELPVPDFEMGDIMFGDEPAEPDQEHVPSPPRPTSRNRRRSFLEAERKMKEIRVYERPRYQVPPPDEDTVMVRRRRYSVSTRKIQPNSLVDLSAVSQPTPPIKTGPPIDINDDDLESLWNRVKDNADLKYPKSMAGLAVLTSYRQRTLEAETSADDVTLPWTEIYRPRSTKEFIGNRAAVQQLLEWLRKWKKRLQRQEMNLAKSKETASKKRHKYDDDEWTEEDDDCESTLSNMAFIRGPTGIGKTRLVYALAEELGFKVIEVNCSSLRSNKRILSSLEGATQCHRINPNMVAPLKRLQRTGFVAPSLPSQGIKKFFTPATKLKNGRKTPPTAPTQALDVITIDDDDEEAAEPMPENNNKERSMSIILFDDVDVIFEADERFWQGVREIAQNSMVPIMMTCKDYDRTDFPLHELTVENVQLHRLNAHTAARYYRLLLLSRRIALENEKDFDRYCQKFNGDLRSCLMGLQFWLDNRTSSNGVKAAKNRRRAKTPPPVSQKLAIETLRMEVDEEMIAFDWNKYEMRCVAEQYSAVPNLKWPSRVLDGLSDHKSMGSIKDDTLETELPPDTVKDRLADGFMKRMEKMENADKASVLGSEVNVEQISAFRQVTINTCPDSASRTFHRTDFIVDYLPAMRSIAASEKEAKLAGSRSRRRLRYLHKIGLDDRSGILQALLEENPFME